MKKLINTLYLIFFFLFLLSSCSDESETGIPSVGPDVNVFFTMKITQIGISEEKTKAVNETQISAMNVLIFEDTGSGYRFSYLVDGYLLNNTSTTEYNFYARISPSDDPLKFYLVANAPATINNISVGMTEAQIKQIMTESFTTAGLDGDLSMFGEIEFPSGLVQDTQVAEVVPMLRSIARADVVSTASNFTLASVQIYRASNAYQAIPNSMADGKVTTPSIPTSTTQTINTAPVYVNGNISQRQLYLPESPMPAQADRQSSATVVVIGGVYGNDADTTYYRLDFVPDSNPELFGQILRNHRYIFTIEKVLASGWRTPDEAAIYGSSNISVEVKEWDENTVGMVFDEINYFGVSSRVTYIGATNDSQEIISVDTNLDTYTLYWTDENGVINPDIPPITLSEEFSDDIFTVSISADGTSIIIVANESNSSGSEIRRYLRVEAGRLRLQLTLVQDILRLAMRPLNILGSRYGLGSFGDQVFGGSAAGDRTRNGLIPLLNNLDNFGPNGTVTIESIMRAAQNDNANIPPAFAYLFDVIYLTFDRNPDQANSDFILNWLSSYEKRMLIVQYDNLGTNNNILVTLGIPQSSRTTGSQIPPFTVHPDAPPEIMNGVFGEVSSSLQFRSFDDTHGAININTAIAAGATPILINNAGNMVLGIDINKRIIYCGDIDLYNTGSNGRAGEYLNSSGTVDNDASRLIANLFAWMATVCLTE